MAHPNPACPCAACKAKLAAARAYPSPDPYAAGLKAMRAAASTPESRFAEQFAADRRRDFKLARSAR